MRFYASKTHDKMNTRDFSVELVTPYVCLNPYYPVTINDPSVHYILDSGAFQDVRTENRLTYEGALERQLAFEDRVGVRQEQLVSYDRLVDEQVRNGVQIKERVSLQTGREYVKETIGAQKYLADQRGLCIDIPDQVFFHRDRGLIHGGGMVLSNRARTHLDDALAQQGEEMFRPVLTEYTRLLNEQNSIAAGEPSKKRTIARLDDWGLKGGRSPHIHRLYLMFL